MAEATGTRPSESRLEKRKRPAGENSGLYLASALTAALLLHWCLRPYGLALCSAVTETVQPVRFFYILKTHKTQKRQLKTNLPMGKENSRFCFILVTNIYFLTLKLFCFWKAFLIRLFSYKTEYNNTNVDHSFYFQGFHIFFLDIQAILPGFKLL